MSNENRVLEVRTSQSESERVPSDFVLRASQVWLLFAVLEILISLRIGLKMVGADPDNTIVALILRHHVPVSHTLCGVDWFTDGWWHRLGNLFPVCHVDLCPGCMGYGKSGLADLLPPAWSHGWQY